MEAGGGGKPEYLATQSFNRAGAAPDFDLTQYSRLWIVVTAVDVPSGGPAELQTVSGAEFNVTYAEVGNVAELYEIGDHVAVNSRRRNQYATDCIPGAASLSSITKMNTSINNSATVEFYGIKK